MRRLREILHTQYIGAIVVGVVLSQGVLAAIGLAIEPLQWYVRIRNQSQGSVLFQGKPEQTLFPWDAFLLGVANSMLYFVVSYLIARWLYFGSQNSLSGDDSRARSEVPAE